jgi:YbbR domain-containing protein
VQVTPPSITLAFEPSASKQVPVVPAIEGSPAPGYVVGKMTADPKTVEVVGPQSAVERVTEALTEPISVTGAKEAVTDTVTIGFQDPLLRLKSPRLANVTVQVVPGPVERTLRDRGVRLRNLGAGLSAQAIPSAVQVVLRGSRQGVSRVDADAISPYVDLNGLGAGDYVVSVKVEDFQEAGVARIDPATVQIRITSAKD